MPGPAGEIEYWVDELWEKHECGAYGRYSPPKAVDVRFAGRSLTLISPFEIDPGQVVSLTASEDGDLIYLIAEEPRPDENPPRVGILIVARRREAHRFAVVVWHILSGWAFKYLGLPEAGMADRSRSG